MRKHTPSPWGAAHVYGTCYSVQCAGGQYHIGTVRGKHNARLIAASPDLLEALQGVVRVADRATVEFDAARAAIAKATGEKQ